MPFNQRQDKSTVKIGGQIEPDGGYEYYYFASQDCLGAQLIINMMDAQRQSYGSYYSLDCGEVLSCRDHGSAIIKEFIDHLSCFFKYDGGSYTLTDMNYYQREAFRGKFHGDDSYALFVKFVDLVAKSNRKYANRKYVLDQFYPSTEKKYLSWGPPEDGNPKFQSMPEAMRNYQSSHDYWSRHGSKQKNHYVMHTGNILQLIEKFGDVIQRNQRFSERHVWRLQANSFRHHPRFMFLDHEPTEVQRKKMCFQVIKGHLRERSRCNILKGSVAKRVVAAEMRRQNLTVQNGERQVLMYSIVLRARDLIFKSHGNKLDNSFKENGFTDFRYWVTDAKGAAKRGYDYDNKWSHKLTPRGTSEKHSEVLGHMTRKSLQYGELMMQVVTVVVANGYVDNVRPYNGDKFRLTTPNVLKLLQIQAKVYDKFRHIMKLKVDMGKKGITTLTPELVRPYLCDQVLGNPGPVRNRIFKEIFDDRLAESLYTIYKKEIWVYLLEIVDNKKIIHDAKNLNKFLNYSGIVPDVFSDIIVDNLWEKIKTHISLLKGCLSSAPCFNNYSQSISDYMRDLFSQEYQWCFYALEHGWDAECPKLKQSYISILLNRLGGEDKNSKRVLQPLLVHALEQGTFQKYLHDILGLTSDSQRPCAKGGGFIYRAWQFFSSSNSYRSEDIYDAKRVMSAFLWSMHPAHVISLARKNCFGILPKEETRFYHYLQQLSIALSQGKSAEDIVVSSADTIRIQLIFDFYDYNPALLCFCLDQVDPVYGLHPNLIKLCIDAWIKKVGCKKRINKKYSPYAIRSINTILRSDDAFSHSCAEGKDIILKVLVFLSLEHEAFKTPGDHHDILPYLKTFVTDYFLEPGNISNLGASASAAGEHVIYNELLHYLLRLEHAIVEDSPDLQILSRDYIASLVNNRGADLAYFYFMQRLYVVENEIYRNSQVYNRLRIMPDSYAKQFYNCYMEQCWLQGSDIRARVAAKLGNNLLSTNIDDPALGAHINRKLGTKQRGRCVDTFDRLVRVGGLFSLERAIDNVRACTLLLTGFVGHSASVGLSDQGSLAVSQHRSALFSRRNGNGLDVAESCRDLVRASALD